MGEWLVTQIGTPAEALDSDTGLNLNFVEKRDVRWIAAPRAMDSNKGTYGHALILAGSLGKTGAAAMAARAALRAGAGLVTVGTAKSALPMIASSSMEIMTEPLTETESASDFPPRPGGLAPRSIG